MPLLQLFPLGCQVFSSFLLLAVCPFSKAYHTFFHFTSIFAATAPLHPKIKPSPGRIFVVCGMGSSSALNLKWLQLHFVYKTEMENQTLCLSQKPKFQNLF